MPPSLRVLRSSVPGKVPTLAQLAGNGGIAINTADGIIYVSDGTTVIRLGTDTSIFDAASQAAMLALPADKGDIARRTDIGKTYVLSANTPTVLAAWKEVLAAPTTLPAAAVSVRKTATQALTTSAAAVLLDTIDVQNDSSVCAQHTTTDALIAKQAGVYFVYYSALVVDTTTASNVTLSVLLNGTAYPPLTRTVNPRSTVMEVTAILPMVLAANDVVALRALRSSSSGSGVLNSASFGLLRVDGLQGTQGPAGAPGSSTVYRFNAAQMDNPSTANWAVNGLAPAAADGLNSSLTIRAFDDTGSEGVGFTADVPSGLTTLNLQLKSRCASAQAAARNAVFQLYARPIKDGVAVGAWTSVLLTANYDTTTNFKYQTFTASMATLGIGNNEFTQFELVRVGANAGDTVVGDVNLLELVLSFT